VRVRVGKELVQVLASDKTMVDLDEKVTLEIHLTGSSSSNND